MRNFFYSRTACIAILAMGAVACGESAEPASERRGVVDAGVPVDATFLDGAFAPGDTDAMTTMDATVDMDLRDAADVPAEVRSVETELGSESTAAGLGNRVSCRALDARGDPIEGVETRFEVRPAMGWSRVEDTEEEIMGVVAGSYSVTCAIPTLGLRDATPARWAVTPGEAARVRTTVSEPAVSAGEGLTVGCEAADAYGNPIDVDEAPLMVQPAGAGIVIEGQEVTITAAGRYTVTCDLQGPPVEGARVTVAPGLPAAIVATVTPDLPVHTSGSVIAYTAIVMDAFDNAVDNVALAWSAAPALQSFGEGRYITAEDGRFLLRVEVMDATLDGVELVAEAEILVDSGGPTIACTQPAEGAMVRLGDAVVLAGQVADLAGLDRFEVDGEVVELDEMGRFSVEVPSRWGLNVRELTARDRLGNENSIFCSYFAAGDYLGEAETRSEGLQLYLGDDAVDDDPPNQPIASIGDILRAILNSPGLVATVDASLSAQNPILDDRCVQYVAGRCILRVGAEYRGATVRGPNDASVRLVDDGVRLEATVRNFDVDIAITGDVSRRGTITVESLSVGALFDMALVAGVPQVTLVGVPDVQMGNLDPDFEGQVLGPVFNLVFEAFEERLSATFASTVADFMTSEVDTLLSGFLGGIALEDLAQTVQVPGIGAGEPIDIAFQPEWSSLAVDASAVRIGLGTQVTGPVGQAAPSAGIPLLPAGRGGDVPAREMAARVHLDVVNQVLHRLWRAGLFNIADAGVLAGQAGIAVGLRLLTPPAIEGLPMGNRVRLHFGPAVAEMAYPGLVDEPVQIRLASTVVAEVAIENGTEFVFGPGDGGFSIETLRMTIEGSSMSAQERAAFEVELRRIVEGIAGQLLGDAIPRLPIPEFVMEDLAAYGIPDGTALGLRNPTMDVSRTRFTLGGDFGQ